MSQTFGLTFYNCEALDYFYKANNITQTSRHKQAIFGVWRENGLNCFSDSLHSEIVSG